MTADNGCMSESKKRQPAGIPVGGQFAANEHDEAGALNVAPTISLVEDMYGETKTFAQISEEHGVENSPESIAAWAAENGQGIVTQDRITFDGDDSIDFEEIAQSYRGNGDYDIQSVSVFPNASSGSEDDAAVVVTATGNLLWNDEFTNDELDHYQPVVEQAYKDWFGAEIQVPDEWDAFDVEMSRDVPRNTLCDSTVGEAAWGISAKWHNETDPGTYGSPYFGAELRRRIDDSRVAQTGGHEPVPADLSKEEISDQEAVSIAAEINTKIFEAMADTDVSPLRNFTDRGVLSISETEKMIESLQRDERKHMEEGTMTLRRIKRINELSGALQRWMGSKPNFGEE